MNEVSKRNLVVRVELTCFYCGHSVGDIRVPTSGRATYRDIRDALETMPAAPTIEWDAHGSPRCPRCRGKLFIEESERRVAYATPMPSPR